MITRQVTPVGARGGTFRWSEVRCSSVTDDWCSHLSTVKSLRVLSLDRCSEMTTAGLAYLSTLDNLRSLKLRRCNQLSEDALSVIGSLTEVEELALEGVKSSFSSCEPLLKLTRLVKLSLNGCVRVCDVFVNELAELNLETLTMESCHAVTESGFKCLGEMKTLRHLSLLGCEGLNDGALEVLSNRLLSLEYLNIQDTGVTGAGIARLDKLQKLRFLAIGGAKTLTLENLSALQRLGTLRELRVSANAFSHQQLARLRKSLLHCAVYTS